MTQIPHTMTSKQCDHISKHQRVDGLNRHVETQEILETKTKLGVDVMDTKQMFQGVTLLAWKL